MMTFKFGQSSRPNGKYASIGRDPTPIQTIATEDDLRRPRQKVAHGGAKAVRKTRSVDDYSSSHKALPNIPLSTKRNMADTVRGRASSRVNGLVRQPLDQRAVKNLPPNSVVLAVFSPDDDRNSADDEGRRPLSTPESRRSHRSRDDDSSDSDDDDRRHHRRHKRGSSRSRRGRRRSKSNKRRHSDSSESGSDSYEDYEPRRHSSRHRHPQPQYRPPPQYIIRQSPPPMFPPATVPVPVPAPAPAPVLARPPVSPPAYNRHQVAAIIEYLDQAKSMRQQPIPPAPPPPPPLAPLQSTSTLFGSGRYELGRRSTSSVGLKPSGIHHPPDPSQQMSDTDSDPEVVLEKFLSRRKAEKERRANLSSKTAHPL